jgi:RNA polymerase sigma factor (sigma-70 family)
MDDDAESRLVDVFRDEWPRLIAVAARTVGDLQSAEDVVQDVFVTAVDRWPLLGWPARPGAWLMTATRNRALNVARDRARAQRRDRAVAPAVTAFSDPPTIKDDRLRLIAMCCHPLLSPDAQVALTLRMVAGLSTEQIARGFHEPATTVAQRLVRAKRTLAEHRLTLSTDDPDLTSRLPSVLDVVFLIFNEGYLASAGPTLTRGDLAEEAYRLARLLTTVVPNDCDVWALRALIAFPLSRWSTRTDDSGALLTLDVQPRTQWNRRLIADGIDALARARQLHSEPSRLLLQAELAACHATAETFNGTDWARIVTLYDQMLKLHPTPVIALNRAVAIAMTHGPAVALGLVDELVDHDALRSNHRVWSVRADLHRRLGSVKAAIADYDRALGLVDNEVERSYLAGVRGRLLAE